MIINLEILRDSANTYCEDKYIQITLPAYNQGKIILKIEDREIEIDKFDLIKIIELIK